MKKLIQLFPQVGTYAIIYHKKLYEKNVSFATLSTLPKFLIRTKSFVWNVRVNEVNEDSFIH